MSDNSTVSVASSGFLGLLSGATGFALIAPMYVGAELASMGTFVAMPIMAALSVAVILIGKRIHDQYENDPLKLITASFFLCASSVILSLVLGLMIIAAATAAVNPFTLPMIATAGACALILLGLYILTKPQNENPIASMCRFFFCPKNNKPVASAPTQDSQADDELESPEVLISSVHA